MAEKVAAEHPLEFKELPYRLTPKVYNHQAFYEQYRNESAIALGKASFKGEGNADKVWEIKTNMRTTYDTYLAGQISKEQFETMLKTLMQRIKTLVYGN